jgi:hypothetical protein
MKRGGQSLRPSAGRPRIPFLFDTAEPMSFVVSGKPSWREAVKAFDELSLSDSSQT